jgi:hypothetical protein
MPRLRDGVEESGKAGVELGAAQGDRALPFGRLVADQASPTQRLEVVGERRLRNVGVGDLALRHGLRALGDEQSDQLQPCRVAQRRAGLSTVDSERDERFGCA